MILANASLYVPSQSYGVGLDYHKFIAWSPPLGRKEAITVTSIRSWGVKQPLQTSIKNLGSYF